LSVGRCRINAAVAALWLLLLQLGYCSLHVRIINYVTDINGAAAAMYGVRRKIAPCRNIVLIVE